MPEQFRLPHDYNVQVSAGAYVDGQDNLPHVMYQPAVYQAAQTFAARAGARHIVDIGCGDAEKTMALGARLRLDSSVLIDHEFVLDRIRDRFPQATFIAADLNRGVPEIPQQVLQNSVVICSDVIEHVSNPDPLLAYLSSIKAIAMGIFLSTPDRAAERGYFDYGPPANPFHVREWTLDELTRLLNDYGFSNRVLAGMTVSNTLSMVKATSLVISSRYFDVPSPDADGNAIDILVSRPCKDLKELQRALRSQSRQTRFDAGWCVFRSPRERVTGVNLRTSVVEQLQNAHAHGFDTIMGTTLSIAKRHASGTGSGHTHLLCARQPRFLAVHADLLRILESNAQAKPRIYPLNLLAIHCATERSLRQRLRQHWQTKTELGLWHENLSRSMNICELAFGSPLLDQDESASNQKEK